MKEDNQAVIKALNMYGRVPEMWELLEEIERLKQDNEYLNKVNIELSSRNTKATEYIKENICTFPAIPQGVYDLRNINLDKLLDILKGSDKEWK